ncbi:1-acyl-sn-glycerol-3-phosphate acyltransferase [Cryobacterium sp.]|jgi:1-acyl-sn-glycerol-3-phosphate acyltransferase|uniref:lysophospholipid acyltransferase family protein n=1 Tax=Cryobacterium sp. TaxID=1926290 RepID=UPI002613E717|nr:lysophospholipid acyltransferase family protein [Cryobacterium sp.]MCU1446260.1 1-acyl-sn-glycerol-3-phosphate acyltransferase [Cryobacterium sp.]
MRTRTREPIYTAAITAGRTVFGLFRLRPTVTGLSNLPDAGGAVLAITHFGYADFALVEWMMWRKNRRHIRFMAKKGAFDKPVVGTLLRGMRHINVDMAAGAQAYADAVRALNSGELIGVFPEGGVNASFTVRELKSGAARMAQEANVPIVPIAVWGGHRLLTKNHKPSLTDAYGTPVSFAVGTPIRVSATDDAQAVTLVLHGTLQGLVDGLQARYPVPGAGRWWQPAHLGGTAPTPGEAAATEAERQLRKAADRAAKA